MKSNINNMTNKIKYCIILKLIMSTFFELEPGDFLVRGGHVAFYLGGTDSKGSDGFGWGEVRSEFPQHTSYKRAADNRFGNNYWRIYRYTGRKR